MKHPYFLPVFCGLLIVSGLIVVSSSGSNHVKLEALPLATALPKPAPKPARKFKVGDCILNTGHHEKWEPNPPRIVDAIGDQNYHVPGASHDGEYSFETLDFQNVERNFKKVNCPAKALLQ